MYDDYNFTVGEIVEFFDNKFGYEVGPHNPLLGTKWHVKGIVKEINGDWIYVEWDNGNTNSYKRGTIRPTEKTEDQIDFGFKHFIRKIEGRNIV